MTIVTQWDNLTMGYHNTVSVDDTCPYCEKPHHTREQCWVRKFDGDLKDKVKILIPSLKKIYKGQTEILQQGGLRPYQEKTMRSILHTLQGMTIGGDRIKELVDTDKYHQGERMKNKEHAYVRKQPRDLQNRGRVTIPRSTQDREDQEYEGGYQSYQEDQRSTYDYDQDYQEHDDQDGKPRPSTRE